MGAGQRKLDAHEQRYHVLRGWDAEDLRDFMSREVLLLPGFVALAELNAEQRKEFKARCATIAACARLLTEKL